MIEISNEIIRAFREEKLYKALNIFRVSVWEINPNKVIELLKKAEQDLSPSYKEEEKFCLTLRKKLEGYDNPPLLIDFLIEILEITGWSSDDPVSVALGYLRRKAKKVK